MADLSGAHGSSEPDRSENAGTIARNARNGLMLFAVYLLLYGGFMYLNAFEPKLMASTPFGGANLAILYGFGLILAALVLAAVYMFLCRSHVEQTGTDA